MINPLSIQVTLPYEAVQAFCVRWKITELALFGSVLRDDFRDDSDIDVLVSFADDAIITLFDLVTIADELETIFNRPVDIVTKRSVEQSDNHIRKKNVLESMQVIYET